MTEEQKKIELGMISFTGRDIGGHECKFDRMAIDGSGRLYVLSIVTEQMKAKAIRSILNGGAKAQIQASGVRLRRPSETESWQSRGPGNLMALAEGYNCWSVKLGYGMVHCLLVGRAPGFMNVLTRDSLWLELNDNRFTTPIVPEWMQYVEEKLVSSNKLYELYCLRCSCGLLQATTSDLDKIVEGGLTGGYISIPEPACVVESEPILEGVAS